MVLYRFIKPLARVALRVFFKKIYFTNLHLLPVDKPLILAVNHPTAFIEPCILATSLEKELNFLARGDFFVQPFYARLLRSLGILPVYRMKDGGFESIKNNFDTFSITHRALAAGQTIMILAEGSSIHEKRLRPIQKGAARIAFGAIEEFGKENDVYIVPIGVNYTNSDEFRSEVMIEIAEPIRVLDYITSYEKNKASTIKKVTSELETRLKEKVIHIEKEEDIDLVEKHFELSRNAKFDTILPILSVKGARLKSEKRISKTINDLSEIEKNALKEKTNDYFQELEKRNISDYGLLKTNYFGLGSTLALAFGFVPFLIGSFFNAPPLLLANFIKKNKVTYIEFQSSVAIAVGMIAYLIWWFLLIGLSVFSGNASLVFTAFLLPALGYFALLYKEFYQNFRSAFRANRIDIATKNRLLQLRSDVIL